MYIRMILWVVPQDLKLLPLLNKNLQSHSLKNLHSNLLYCVTVCFLIFQATNFMALYSFNGQMMELIFGGDISMVHLDMMALPNVDQNKLVEILDPLYEEHGGPIQMCTYNDAWVTNQFQNSGFKKLEEFVVGDGFVWEKAKLGRVLSKSVERNVLQALALEHVWWPNDWVKQPFGPNTKTYSDIEIIDLLYDLEDYSDYTRNFD